MVFILLAKFRLRDSLISILDSLQFVMESIIKCKYSDCKFNEETDGDNQILVHGFFWALLECLCFHVTRLCSLSCLWLFQYIPFYKVKWNIKIGVQVVYPYEKLSHFWELTVSQLIVIEYQIFQNVNSHVYKQIVLLTLNAATEINCTLSTPFASAYLLCLGRVRCVCFARGFPRCLASHDLSLSMFILTTCLSPQLKESDCCVFIFQLFYFIRRWDISSEMLIVEFGLRLSWTKHLKKNKMQELLSKYTKKYYFI